MELVFAGMREVGNASAKFHAGCMEGLKMSLAGIDGLMLTSVSLEREQLISFEVCECEFVSVCPCATQTNSSMVAAYKQSQVTMQPGNFVTMSAHDALWKQPGV